MPDNSSHDTTPTPKSVGILSMQRILNYGSILQAYSLMSLVEDCVPGATVRFIDYRPGAPLDGGSGKGRRRTGFLGRLISMLDRVVGYTRRGISVVDVVRYYHFKRTFGDRWWSLIRCTDQFDYSTNVDVEIIGSDEVFNCTQSGHSVGYVPALFGAGSEAGRLVSYAASFGSTTLGKLEATGVIDEVSQNLRTFDAISVRDGNSLSIVSHLTSTTPTLCVDPVLAHDIMQDPRIPKGRMVQDKYVISYGYSGRISDDESLAIRAFARKIGAKILCFGGVQAHCDRFVDCGPFELLAYFRDAEAVVTDTFHGTIFSLINNTPFATFVRHSDSATSTSNSNKLEFLLGQFGVSDRAASAETLSAILAKEIAWADVNRVLATERARSRAFISESVDK